MKKIFRVVLVIIALIVAWALLRYRDYHDNYAYKTAEGIIINKSTRLPVPNVEYGIEGSQDPPSYSDSSGFFFWTDKGGSSPRLYFKRSHYKGVDTLFGKGRGIDTIFLENE